jgi:hypothetical protein
MLDVDLVELRVVRDDDARDEGTGTADEVVARAFRGL